MDGKCLQTCSAALPWFPDLQWPQLWDVILPGVSTTHLSPAGPLVLERVRTKGSLGVGDAGATALDSHLSALSLLQM
jgi:hypothetical protein